MKKNQVWFPAVFIIFFCGISVNLYGSANPPGKPYAEKLNGEWDFIWHEFITSSSDSGANWHHVTVPGTWNNYSRDIKPAGANGYGTFRRRIILKTSNGGIVFPDVLSAHTVYIDTTFLYSCGKPATFSDQEQFGNFNHLYRLPAHYKEGDTVTIYLQVSNFHYRFGGIMRTPELGEYEMMASQKSRNAFWQSFQMGAVCLMAIFTLIYASVRSKEKYAYILVLLCAGIFLYNSLNGEFLWLVLFPSMNGELVMQLTYLSFYLGVTLHFLLVAELYRDEFPRWIEHLFTLIGLSAAVSVIFLPMEEYSHTMPYFQMLTLISTIYLIIKVFILARKKQPGAKLLATGITIIFVFLVLELMFVYKIGHTSIFGWGVLIYLLMLVFVLSRRFSSAVINEERLLAELRGINEHLETKVRDRTSDIEAKKLIIEQQQHDIISKNKELMRAREEEKNMLKVIIHDLKAPFNKIAGLINISRMTVDGKGKNSELDQTKLNEMIAAVADEGKSLIEDLNTLTFFESFLEDQSGYKEVDLIKYLKQLVRSHQSYAENKSLELQFDSGEETYIGVTHPHALTRIVDNLLSNAIKFSPVNKNVWVELFGGKESYSITIRDEGPGFTKEDQQQLFHKFQRLSAKPTKGETSTGLGLNIVKSLTEGLGGHIELISGENEGACFRLTFNRQLNNRRN